MIGEPMPDEVRITSDEWVAVVDRAIQLVGEDHVALGSDLDGGPTLHSGMRDIRDLAMITDAMLRRGYSEERIRKFLGGNLLRVFRQVTGEETLVRTSISVNFERGSHSPGARIATESDGQEDEKAPGLPSCNHDEEYAQSKASCLARNMRPQATSVHPGRYRNARSG